MISFAKIEKWFLRKEKFVILVLILFYLATRLFNLTRLPIFTDESIYIYWAKFIGESHSNWFISLTDGKPPLLIWIIAFLLKFFPPEMYLLAGRLPSVFFGGLCAIGIYKISNLFFKNQVIAYLSVLTYTLFPFSFVYDKMALFDSMLSSMLLWAAYYCLKTADDFSLKNVFFWGFFLGLGYLSKGTAIIFSFLLPICYLIFQNVNSPRHNPRKIIIAIFLSTFISQILNNLQRISKIYYMVAQKNQQFQQPIDQILENPFRLLIGNSQGIFSWIQSYYSLPLLVFGLFSFAFLFLLSKHKAGILLILWFAPMFVFAFIARELFPRYLLFTTPYFIIVFAYGFFEFAKHIYQKFTYLALLLFVIFLPLFYFDYFLLTNPALAPFPGTDFNQYVGEHPSGYGLDKIFWHIDKIIEKEDILLITQVTFGLYPYAFYLNYWGNPKVKINPVWPVDLQTIKSEFLVDRRTFLVVKELVSLPQNFPFPIAAIGNKQGGKYPIILSVLK